MAVKWWQSFPADAEAFWASLEQQLTCSSPQKRLNTHQPTFAFHVSSLQRSAHSVSASVTHRFWMVAVAGSKHLLFNFLSLTTATSWHKGPSLDRETEELGSLKEILHLPAFCIHLAFGTLKFIQIKQGKLTKYPDPRSLSFFWDKKPTWRASVRAAI